MTMFDYFTTAAVKRTASLIASIADAYAIPFEGVTCKHWTFQCGTILYVFDDGTIVVNHEDKIKTWVAA